MIKRLAQLIIVLIPVTLFVWLLVIDIAPGGEFIVRHEVAEKSAYINSILPEDRTFGIQYNADGDAFTTIINDPVYFSVQLPNTEFDQIEVELEFANGGQSIIELGGLVDIFSEGYDLQPIHNLIIENSEWTRIEDSGVVLLQRVSNFLSIDNFLLNLPDRSEIATYQFDLENAYRISNYSALGYQQTFDVSLRGYHKYQTYIKNENFNLELTYMDMNRTIGSDGGVIRVWNESDQVMFETEFKDDGNETDNQISSKQSIVIDKSGWPEGVYSVELSGTSDIFWRQIKTSQRYLTFVNKLYLGDDIGYLADSKSTSFYTNSKNLSLETYHADATQRVTLGADEVKIPYSHEKVTHTVEDAGVVYGHTPAGDVKITGDGKFSLSANSFFDPDPVKLNAFTNLDALGVNYIIAEYPGVTDGGDWKTANATFDIAELYKFDNSIKFIISLPAITTLQETVDVHAINVIFKKDPMNIWEFTKAVLKYLPGI
ncbi:hypothetical protein CO057_03290 [Candidatus Uhrbacteria bacterium CG_4_9_14_0_2_um_filter_41_50]|uniref:Uncharacterized protein n=1 Tax=Candidatus Uhrbacteria bacterium CG_4_9_14_0_2_um_filter_41_50 TaxID=1975031 RepID=A0A2M8ENJ3_9BACT|nr:MAG: hypothetical protein COZ45_03580 [Candidatus Uhrbacteria bacterium CG_4_10_14_3_um_filter_41_21]PIZ55114.1 MAG: hypothetical protein COY24_01625 [Candidatus Uhrbacteria bacterium CG_4_10_14_0_2_um_filter_41_21]PJB84444.1 MAG: hypothetical protein CO086_03750 [Candidatus Uhrbacteria bacterium CG_4_9_14_0_8_um_filter_41_16]PJC24323.1 MAG: hypothetical protein CO057_03290 [Candidatus Uhrbacteria bacterium CG_4_9_14_0_2_um_filter_41_50]PJE75314.1 MAG: hypothetical protein COV03_00915 [Candi